MAMNTNELNTCLYEIIGKRTTWLDDAALLDVPGEYKLYLEYSQEKDELYLQADIAAIEGEALARCAMTLLEANLYGRDTGGSAVLAYDAEEGKVVLWDKLELSGMTPETFKERFSFFYLARLHWTVRLRDEAPEAALAASAGMSVFTSCS